MKLRHGDLELIRDYGMLLIVGEEFDGYGRLRNMDHMYLCILRRCAAL